mgnify:FL=1
MLFEDMESASSMAGAPSAFQHLWTPHRMVYLKTGQQPADEDCPFCLAVEKSDEDGLIFHRGEHAYALLNLFPYNPGHVLICPYRHIASYEEASPAEAAEIAAITQKCMKILRSVSGAHGFNIGMNQGEVAGAGIAGHLHQHIVPRWRNDANFLPIIAQTKAMPQLLGEVRAQLAAGWDAS